MSLETEVFCLSTYLGSRSSLSHSVYTCLLSIYSCLRHDPGNSRELQLGPRTPATAPISWISRIFALLFKKASYLFCACARVCGGGTQSWHTWGDQRTSCRNHSSLCGFRSSGLRKSTFACWATQCLPPSRFLHLPWKQQAPTDWHSENPLSVYLYICTYCLFKHLS